MLPFVIIRPLAPRALSASGFEDPGKASYLRSTSNSHRTMKTEEEMLPGAGSSCLLSPRAGRLALLAEVASPQVDMHSGSLCQPSVLEKLT